MLTLTSAAFADHHQIPNKYTCQGEDISPPLSWSGAPAGTKSFALIVDDPDAPDPAAPKMTWVHWLLYNLSPNADHLPEAVSSAVLPVNPRHLRDRKSTRLNSSHQIISYAVFCLKKKKPYTRALRTQKPLVTLHFKMPHTGYVSL